MGAAGAGALAVVVPGVFPAGVTVTLTDEGMLACGAFDVGTVFTANSGLAFGALVAATGVEVWADGTLPAPGVPMPGKTVPCCKLPTFGWVAEGAATAMAVCGAAGACFSGKLIGGSLGGTGIGACAV